MKTPSTSGTAFIRSLATASSRLDMLSVSVAASAAVLPRRLGRMMTEAVADWTELAAVASETLTAVEKVRTPEMPPGVVDTLVVSADAPMRV